MNGEKMPTITYCVVAYNQENYIEDAVLSAFSQDYSPLEIILSDDNSTDKTFEIIRRLTENYSGSHKISINKNPTNLGIIGHINKIASLASGKLIFVAAGDDISCSNRVSLVVRYWLATDKRYWFIYSKVLVVDSLNREIGTLGEAPKYLNDIQLIARFRFSFITGASQVWDRRLLVNPDKIPESVKAEDRFLAFRAWLTKREFGYIDEPLVRYRIHDRNMSVSNATTIESSINYWQHRLDTEISYLNAVIHEMCSMKSNKDIVCLKNLLEREMLWAKKKKEVYSLNLLERLSLFKFAPRFSSYIDVLPVLLFPTIFPTFVIIVKRVAALVFKKYR